MGVPVILFYRPPFRPDPTSIHSSLASTKDPTTTPCLASLPMWRPPWYEWTEEKSLGLAMFLISTTMAIKPIFSSPTEWLRCSSLSCSQGSLHQPCKEPQRDPSTWGFRNWTWPLLHGVSLPGLDDTQLQPDGGPVHQGRGPLVDEDVGLPLPRSSNRLECIVLAW